MSTLSSRDQGDEPRKAGEPVHNEARPAGKNVFAAATVAGLLTVYLILLLLGAFHDSVTVDEFALVPSGYAKLLYPGKVNWLNTTNPPLIQVMLAFPLLFMHCELPETWIAREFPELRWEIGIRFMYANRDKYINAFFLARLVSIALAVLLAFFVYRWSRELFGIGGGMVSLALTCFCPASFSSRVSANSLPPAAGACCAAASAATRAREVAASPMPSAARRSTACFI